VPTMPRATPGELTFGEFPVVNVVDALGMTWPARSLVAFVTDRRLVLISAAPRVEGARLKMQSTWFHDLAG
jgi:hypothetical protein